MGCNCGDNEYNITVNNNGNCKPTTPIYNITLANVGVNGYSPIVRFINETVESFNIAVDNITGTETSPAVPKLSYVADQINNINTTIAGLNNTYLIKDGSNAANPINLNGMQISSNYGDVTIDVSNIATYNSIGATLINASTFDLNTNGGEIYIYTDYGIGLNATTNKDIYLDTTGIGKAKYNNKEIATIDQIPTVGNGTITIIQGGVTKGTFTTNQSGNSTIQLDGAIIDNPFVVNASTGYEGNAVLYASGAYSGTDAGTSLETTWRETVENTEHKYTHGLYINNGGRYKEYPSIQYKKEDYIPSTGSGTSSFTDLGFINAGIYSTVPTLTAPIYVTRTGAGYIVSLKYDNDTLKLNQNGELYADVQGGTSYIAGNGINITNNVISVDENDLGFLENDGSNADVNFTVNGIKLSANTITSSTSTGHTSLTLNQTASGNYIDITAGTTGTSFYTNGFSFSSDTSSQIPDIIMSSTGDIKIYPTLGAKLYYGGNKTAANEVATKGNLPTNFIGSDSITGGTSGLVPAPSAGDQDKFLKGDGTWDTVGGGGSSYTAGTGIDITNDTISVDSSVVLTSGNQTILDMKTFRDIKLTNSLFIPINNIDRTVLLADTDTFYIGTRFANLFLAGGGIRPKYNNSEYLALYSDIPTVNNPTITFTQGGVTKGTITLNQSSNQTVTLDAGGGGAVIDDNTSSTTTVYSSSKVESLIPVITIREWS